MLEEGLIRRSRTGTCLLVPLGLMNKLDFLVSGVLAWDVVILLQFQILVRVATYVLYLSQITCSSRRDPGGIGVDSMR